MGKANDEISQLLKKIVMRNYRKKCRRQERAVAKCLAAEEAVTQRISDDAKEQKALAEKYYSKWKNISKEAKDLRCKIQVQQHTTKV
jgi:hypothetical protein